MALILDKILEEKTKNEELRKRCKRERKGEENYIKKRFEL